MPAGVPDGVANSFSALLPAMAIITGATVIYLIWFAKSQQLKTLGKVEAVPAVFGIPIVMNPIIVNLAQEQQTSTSGSSDDDEDW